MNKYRILSFSDRGEALAKKIAGALGCGYDRCRGDITLDGWTAAYFDFCEGLIYVGACGIAVRAIAPHVNSKTSDPAVVVIDEKAIHAVSLLSGHLGGANALARWVSDITGADAVITTATDLSGLFAVDEWAKMQGLIIAEPERIKKVSAKLLQGRQVTYICDYLVAGDVPTGLKESRGETADIRLSYYKTDKKALHAVPGVLVLGIGCKKDTPMEKIERMFLDLTAKYELFREAFVMVCSIDIKSEEKGIIEFAEKYGLATAFYSADELNAAKGDFTPSEFVKSVTDVDNVCERSAYLGSGCGQMVLRKNASEGVTMAVAAAHYGPDWSW